MVHVHLNLTSVWVISDGTEVAPQVRFGVMQTLLLTLIISLAVTLQRQFIQPWVHVSGLDVDSARELAHLFGAQKTLRLIASVQGVAPIVRECGYPHKLNSIYPRALVKKSPVGKLTAP